MPGRRCPPDGAPQAGELKIKERRSWKTWQLLSAALVAAILGMWINGDTGGGGSSSERGSNPDGGKLPAEGRGNSGGVRFGCATTTTAAAGAARPRRPPLHSGGSAATTTTAAGGSTTTTGPADPPRRPRRRGQRPGRHGSCSRRSKRATGPAPRSRRRPPRGTSAGPSAAPPLRLRPLVPGVRDAGRLSASRPERPPSARPARPGSRSRPSPAWGRRSSSCRRQRRVPGWSR